MEKYFEVASKVTKPISIASLLTVVFYAIYKAILELGIFSSLGENNSFKLLDSLANKVFYFALTSLVLGVVSYVIVELAKRKSETKLDSHFLTGNVYSGNGLPVENATVFVDGLDKRKLTDANGWFQIQVPKRKFWTVRAYFDEKVTSQQLDFNQVNEPVILTFPHVEIKLIQTPPPQIIHNLPQPDYGHFIGREQEKNTLTNLLLPHPHSPHYVITILGVGGMGKTALALEIANHYLYECAKLPDEERFNAIVWFSAKETILVGKQILPRWPSQRTIDDLYITIFGVFNIDIDNNLSLPEKDLKIRQILKNQRTLLILDNLETVDDKRLLDFILHPPVPTKIIVTTRHWVSVAYPLQLEGMPHSDAINLIDQQCLIGDIRISDDVKEKLITRTGGIPLALVWCIGLIRSGMPVDAILNLLGNSESAVAKFIFEKSVDQIRGSSALQLLVTLALFIEYASDYKVRQYVTRDELGSLTQLSNADRDESLATLFQLSLINQTSDQFSLLPLTRAYILEQIVGSDETVYQDLRKRINGAVFALSQHTPFVYSAPIQIDRFIGREKEIRAIVNRLARGESTLISGEPRSGKSSLLRYIAHSPAVSRILNEEFKVLMVEISAIDVANPNDFWKYILGSIMNSVEDEMTKNMISDYISSSADIKVHTVERLFARLDELKMAVVILVDEAESFLAKKDFNTAEFWGSLRSLASRLGSFRILLSSSYDAYNLNERTLILNRMGSPFFNIFIEVNLSPFSEKEIDRLFSDALKASQAKFTAPEIKLLSWLSGNHPYRLQVAGSSLFEISTVTNTSPDERNVTVMQQFFERTRNHFDDLWMRYFDDQSKIALLYIGLHAIHQYLFAKNNTQQQELTRLRHQIRQLEKQGWLIEGKNQEWKIPVGGFLLWLIDTIEYRNDQFRFDYLLENSDLVKNSSWKEIYSEIGDLKMKNPVENLARKISSRFYDK